MYRRDSIRSLRIYFQRAGQPWLTLPQEVKAMADWFDKQLVDNSAGDKL